MCSSDLFGSDPSYKPHADALLPALLPLHAQMSPDTYGGAVLLGVDGICIISHGSSGQTAIVNAMKLAHELAGSGMVALLARGELSGTSSTSKNDSEC